MILDFIKAKLRPWARLVTATGDLIYGKVRKDRGLDLAIKVGWQRTYLSLTKQEALNLKDWLNKAYKDDRLVKALPVPDTKATPSQDIGGDG